MTTELPIFLNPHAGRGAETESEALARAFEDAGTKVRVHVVPGAELESSIRAAVVEGAKFIGAAGGDGTISSAANALTGTDSVLLPIPLGTLNHFCKRYGISTVEEAVKAWQQRKVMAIHVGNVNDRVFVNNASCGFYPHVVRHRDRMERFLPRVPAMWLAGFRVLFEFPMMTLDVEINHRVEEVRTAALWVGLGRNSLRLPEADEATEVDGEVLEVVTAEASTRNAAIKLATRLFWHLRKGLDPQAASLEVWRARAFKLDAPHRIDIALDGEPYRMQTPLHFRLRDSELHVLSLI